MIVLAALMTAAFADIDQKNAEMAALYDQLCLQTFPDDHALDAALKQLGARELSPAEVKVTLRDDPGRAWELRDHSATIWLELPPYHACSVRWNSAEIGSLAAYKAVADRYEQKIGNFAPADPWDADMGDIHIHAVGQQRPLSNGGMESLFVFEQHISDLTRRAAGETGHSLRFVHQLAPPEQQPGKPTT